MTQTKVELIDLNGKELVLDADADTSITADTDDQIDFKTGGTDRMHIASDGDVLISKTSNAYQTTGHEFLDGGRAFHTADGGKALSLVRLSSDGAIVDFYKDGTEVGSIACKTGFPVFANNNNDGFSYQNNKIIPTTETGANQDNLIDLGVATSRFNDIFVTNGATTGSDKNEKQSIESLTTAEMKVAKRLSPLIKTFKWNSAVEKKGDSARTHTGIMAQDVQQAFTDEGLDASNYGMFMSNTWWQKEISVDATEDKDAHTYIDTIEEETDGYTEKTRLGIRYSELLSFIQAYNDQRFEELEARVTTLEG